MRVISLEKFNRLYQDLKKALQIRNELAGYVGEAARRVVKDGRTVIEHYIDDEFGVGMRLLERAVELWFYDRLAREQVSVDSFWRATKYYSEKFRKYRLAHAEFAGLIGVALAA